MQVPKNAPVARPWMAAGDEQPTEGRLGREDTWAMPSAASAPISTPLRPTRSDSWPRVSIEGTSAAT